MSKLTDDQKVAIKSADKTNTQLAKEYGVSVMTVSKLKRQGAPPKPHGGVEISLEGDSVVIRLPKKALTKKRGNGFH